MQDDNKYKTFYIDDSEQQDDEINIREIFEKYSYHWKWFLLGVLIALVAASIYLRYATYQYEVSSTILIDDKENGGGLTSELSAFEDRAKIQTDEFVSGIYFYTLYLNNNGVLTRKLIVRK